MAKRKTVQLSPVKYNNSLKRFVMVIFLLPFIRLYSSFGQKFRKGQRLVNILKSSYLSAGDKFFIVLVLVNCSPRGSRKVHGK